ncbi:N,N-dimethylformamidase beta subunit family domain-containing protein [Mycobacterium sp. WMMD1722]|uniref:N,N-dimethylformamidase beta subunit family domain-containing protein n=1 Tax=Mycobacterium sp. WMMD1722 TaxID=3404117 RepID=UPI003BF513C7
MSMPIVGYTDRLTVEPGETVEFKISCVETDFSASLVRLIHGDTNPAGPGFKSRHVPSTIEGVHPGNHQPLRPGSYVRIPHRVGLTPAASFSIHLWMWINSSTDGRQTLLSQGVVDAGGYALRLEDGRIAAGIGDQVVTVSSPILPRRWYSVAAVFDAAAGEVRLDVVPRAINQGPQHHRAVGAITMPQPGPADVLIAAEQLSDGLTGNFYNGKIDSPRIYPAALTEAAMEVTRQDTPERAAGSALAAWDFASDISNWTVNDACGSFHGHTVNKPMRGATGHNWDGSETSWAHAPEQYGAIHFHDDDLADAGWETTFQWTVPDDLSSGVYAAHVTAGDAEDYLPIFVRPRAGHPTAKIALLIPTFSYLAYANEQLLNSPLLDKGDYPAQIQDRYIVENRLLSLYDKHSDGSGVCYSSRLRPVVNMRPKCNMAWLDGGKGSPHQFNADLHIVDWLEENAYEVDVFTDEDLHREGHALLAPYKAVLTGSHHEYWSGEMLDAAQRYLQGGGRLLSLCGNGMYWVTQLDPETGTSVEIRRRGPATRMWEPEPGEAHLSSTGELGGTWRFRGRGPQSWIGAGYTAETAGIGRPFRRTDRSHDEDVAFIFDGVGGELIGDFPCLVNSYGAAGFEFDRADLALGTPAETVILATADGFDDGAQGAIDDVLLSDSSQGGTQSPLVRADMTFLKYPAGGAVFSVSSIAWAGCLSYNGYDNNVSRITRNVLEAFVADEI